MDPKTQKDLEALVSIEIEQSVLGACLFENDVVGRVADFLRPDDFWYEAHAEIFRIMLEMHASGTAFTPPSIHTYMQTHPGYPDGGKDYLVQCAASVPSIISAPDYARHIADLAKRREIYLLGKDVMERASMALFEDSADKQGSSAEEKLTTILSEAPGSTSKTVSKALADWLDDINKRGEEPPGALTGLDEVDAKLGGLRPGKLYIVGGRPGMGKSTVLVHLARRMAQNGGCAFVSGEMEAGELPVMMVTDMMRDRGMRLPYMQAERGTFTAEEFELFYDCSAIVGELPIIIDDRNSPSLGHIRRFASRCAKVFENKGQPFRALFVDYLQIIARNPKLKGTDAIREITQGLIAIGKQFQVPVVAGCQINRGPEGRDDKRPTIADLRESGDIENDAFAVILLYREAYYHSRSEPPASKIQDHEDWALEGQSLSTEKPLEWIIAKNRRGPQGTVITWCEIETGAVRHRSFNPHDPFNEFSRVDA